MTTPLKLALLKNKITPTYMLCPKCNHQNPQEAKFCTSCGNALLPSIASGSTPQVSTPKFSFRRVGKNKKFLVAAGLLLFLLLAIAILRLFLVTFNTSKGEFSRLLPTAQPPSRSSEQKTYKTYLSGYGFSFEYPGGWQYRDIADGVVFSTQNNGQTEDIVFLTILSSPYTIETLKEKMYKSITSVPSNNILSENQTKLDGWPAYEVKYTKETEAGNGKKKVWIIAAVLNPINTTVSFVMGGRLEKYKNYEQGFIHIAKSFKTQLPPLTPGYQIHAFDKYGLVFEYPKLWTKHMVGLNKLYFVAQDNQEPIVLIFFDTNPRFTTIKDLLEENWNTYSDYEAITKSESTLAGQRAVDLRYKRKGYIGRQILTFVNQGTLLSFDLRVPVGEEYEKLEKHFERLIESAHFVSLNH